MLASLLCLTTQIAQARQDFIICIENIKSIFDLCCLGSLVASFRLLLLRVKRSILL